MFEFGSVWKEPSVILESNLQGLQSSWEDAGKYNLFNCCEPKRPEPPASKGNVIPTPFPQPNNMSAVQNEEESKEIIEKLVLKEATVPKFSSYKFSTSTFSSSDLRAAAAKPGKPSSPGSRKNSLGEGSGRKNFTSSLRAFRNFDDGGESSGESPEAQRLKILKAQICSRRNSISNDVLISGRGRYARPAQDI